MSNYSRRLAPPSRSFFLFGPRGTGKSTWLRQKFPAASVYDLLSDRELARLQGHPELFRAEVDALPPGAWVVVDEVQRLPSLLNEVHDVLSRKEKKLHFVLTGSSARKLRRGEANLLAGRALSRQFFPLVAQELGAQFNINRALRFGTLPEVWTAKNDQERTELLQAYRDTYLMQEIRAEGLVRNLDAFTRFLEIAALQNAQVTSLSNISRGAGVQRPTVEGFFEVLQDTLLATLLPAFRPRARVRETAHPKLYLFDTGVARAMAGRLRVPLERAEQGHLLETWVHHELQAYLHDSQAGGSLSYWRTRDGLEVDFIYSRGDRHVGLEVKASERFRPEDAKGLLTLHEQLGLERLVVVFLGARPQKVGPIDVLPVRHFLKELNAGSLLALR